MGGDGSGARVCAPGDAIRAPRVRGSTPIRAGVDATVLSPFPFPFPATRVRGFLNPRVPAYAWPADPDMTRGDVNRG